MSHATEFIGIMKYRHAYCRSLIANGKFNKFLDIMRRFPHPKSLPVLMRFICTPNISNFHREMIGTILTSMGTPKAIEILYTRFMDVATTSTFILHNLPDVYLRDERLVDALLWHLSRRSWKNTRWELGDVAAMHAAKRLQDERFIPILENFIETNQENFYKPFSIYVSLAVTALETISAFTSPKAQSAAQHWHAFWDSIIDEHIANYTYVSDGSFGMMHYAFLKHPKVVDFIMTHLENPKQSHGINHITSVLDVILSHNHTGSQRDVITDRAIKLAYQMPKADRAHLLETLAKHPNPLMIQTALDWLHDPACSASSIKILTETSTFTEGSLQFAQDKLNLYDPLNTVRIGSKSAIIYCEHLSGSQSPEAHQHLLAHLVDKREALSENLFYRYIVAAVPYTDEALEIIAHHLLYEEQSLVALYKELAKLGQRGMSLLITHLRYNLTTNRRIESDLILALGQASFDAAVPLLLETVLTHRTHIENVRTALMSIGSEDAFEALLMIDDLQANAS